jgi:hypothetical protein
MALHLSYLLMKGEAENSHRSMPGLQTAGHLCLNISFSNDIVTLEVTKYPRLYGDEEPSWAARKGLHGQAASQEVEFCL